jgi:hypothetical protein
MASLQIWQNPTSSFSRLSMPAGTFVTHFGKQVHWDGAKDEDAGLLTVGEGPATITRGRGGEVTWSLEQPTRI